MNKRILILVIVTLFVSIVSAKSKDWIMNPYNEYNRNEYLAVVGEGKTKKNAQENALREIAAVFSVSVQSKVFSQEYYQEEKINDQTNFKDIMRLNIETDVLVHQDELIAIEFPEAFYDKKNNIWYVLAIMDLKKTCGIYVQQIIENQEIINTLINNHENNSLVYFNNLKLALKIADENEKMNYRVELLDSSQKQEIIKPSYIRKEIESFAKKNPVYVDIKNDDGTLLSIFKEILEKHLFCLTEAQNSKNQLTGQVYYFYSKSDDNLISFCEIKVNAELVNQETSEIICPISLTVREGGKTGDLAKERVLKTIKMKIDQSFSL